MAEDELARLRAEVEELRSQLDRKQGRQRRLAVARSCAAAVLVALAALGVVVSMVGVWATWTVLDTDRWVATVAPLPRQPEVATAIATYTTDEVFQVVDVRGRLAEVLPGPAAFVAGPLTGQLHELVQRTVDQLVRTDQFQSLWTAANRLVHQQAVAILDGDSQVIAATGDEVRIDLLPVVNQVLRQLEQQLPTLFGHRLDLPDVTSGEVPPQLRAIVGNALGVTLPADFARFTVYRGDELRQLQEGVVLAKRWLYGVIAATVVALAAALWTSPTRRRTLLQFGVWLAVWVVAVTAAMRAVKAQVLVQVPAGVYRSAADTAVTVVFSGLHRSGIGLLAAGCALAVLAYLVGPGRLPVWLRRSAVAVCTRMWPVVRRIWAACPGWIRRHVDLLRVAGVVVAAVVASVLSSWTGLLVVAAVLGAYELALMFLARGGGVARRRAEREAPPRAPAGHPPSGR
ncbi:hypothetical protein [Kutzneria buriramensis]|uniref:Integral membrane protein n=1 Tax=Kutzneria buriramensis TaxID=1045776 RepID=A0A3E0GZU4_9PSEU|nr:hypothetical protein [Kutzneria buriramensis]REH34884.1 hypothetical protein BCF44_119160 [Kutzneria buriramensis]